MTKPNKHRLVDVEADYLDSLTIEQLEAVVADYRANTPEDAVLPDAFFAAMTDEELLAMAHGFAVPVAVVDRLAVSTEERERIRTLLISHGGLQ